MEDLIKIIGIDPGNHLGVSILHIDPYTYNINYIDTRTITLDKYSTQDYLNARLVLLSSIIEDLYYNIRPNCVAMEAAFLNSRYPKAVVQLSQYTGMIEYVFNIIDPTLQILKYPPMYVKSIAGGTGKADKSDMLSAVNNNKELISLLNPDIMTEHEIDAVCIAYTALLEIRNYNLFLLSM